MKTKIKFSFNDIAGRHTSRGTGLGAATTWKRSNTLFCLKTGNKRRPF